MITEIKPCPFCGSTDIKGRIRMETLKFDKVEIREFGYWNGCKIHFKGKNCFLSLDIKEAEIEEIAAVIHELMGKTPDMTIHVSCTPCDYTKISVRTLEYAKSVKELFAIEKIAISDKEAPNA